MMFDTLLGHRFHTEGARRSVSRGSNAIAKLFGLPFFAFGTAIVYFGLTMEMADSQTGESSPIWLQLLIVVVCATPFLALGAATVFGRWGVVIDRDEGFVESWYGLIVPLRRKRRAIGKTDRVVLAISVSHHGNASTGTERTSTGFGVHLNGSRIVELDSFTDERAARAFAERAARTLGLALENRLATPHELRTLDELDVPLAERLRKTGAAPPAQLPPRSRVRLEHLASGGALELCRPGLDSWRAVATLLGIVGFFGWAAAPMVLDGRAVSYGFAALVAITGVAIVWGLFADSFSSVRVVVSPAALEVCKRVGPLRLHRSMKLEELEELYSDGDSIRAVGDRKAFRFAGAHAEQDQAFVLAALRSWILDASGSVPSGRSAV